MGRKISTHAFNIEKYETKNCNVQSIKDHMEEKKLT